MARHWTFDWDPEKAAINRRKHRVSFEEAATVFYDPDAVFLPDPENEVILGYTLSSRLLYTVFVEIEGDVIRIISARLATPLERKQYEENA